MTIASNAFTPAEREEVSGAVAHAEARTAAEIVPVVATASGRYDRGEDLAGLTLGVVSLVLAWTLFQHEDPTAGGWGGLPITLGLTTLVIILVLGFIVGVVLAARIGWLRRVFTPRSEMREEVDARARQLFFDQRVHRTNASTGVLIYISLFERRAVILADAAVMTHLDPEVLEDFCHALTGDLRRSSVADALIRCIERMADRLAEVLPADDSDRNELGDAVITID